MNPKAVITKTVGYFALGLMIWLHGLVLAGWVSAGSGLDQSIAFASQATLLVVLLAVLSFTLGESRDAVIFFVMATLIRTNVVVSQSLLKGGGWVISPAERGWYEIFVALFISAVWLSSLKDGGPRMLFLLTMCLTHLCEALASFTFIRSFLTTAGFLELFAALTALSYAAGTVLGHSYGRRLLPTLRKESG